MNMGQDGPIAKTSLTRDIWLYGQSRQGDAAQLNVVVGPFSFVFHDGMLKHLKLGGVEIARRVYFALRGRDWDTIHPMLSNVKTEQSYCGFQAWWDGYCRRGNDIDYLCKGHLEVTSDGWVAFTVRGQALKEFQTPRVGICLLLSTEATIERSYHVTLLNGERKALRFNSVFPRTQLVSGWRSLQFAPAQGMQVEYSIEGSHFDLEDQRNFGDSSYKAMAGMPYREQIASVGEELGQTLTIGVTSERRHLDPDRSQLDGKVKIQVAPHQASGRIPALGVNVRRGLVHLSADETSLLSDLGAFLHFPLDLDSADLSCDVQQVLDAANGTQSDVSLTLHNLSTATQKLLLASLQRLSVAGIRLLQIACAGPAESELPLLRDCLLQTDGRAMAGKTATGTFKDRSELIEGAHAKADFLAWCSTPLCHQNDDETIMENASVYPGQAETLRSFATRAVISVGPVQLVRHGEQTSPDSRHRGLIAAAFLATSIKYLAEADARSAIFFEAIGPEGLIYRSAPFSQPGYDGGNSRQVFPSYYAMRILTGWAGLPSSPLLSSDRLRVEAFQVHTHPHTTTVLINQRPVAVHVKLNGLAPLRDVGYWSLDLETLPNLHPATDPQKSIQRRRLLVDSSGQLEILLGEYAIGFLTVAGDSSKCL